MIMTVTCSKCGAKVALPEVAVRLTGWLMCIKGHQFQYNWRKYFKSDGNRRKL